MNKIEKSTISLLILLALLLATTIYVYINKILGPTLNNNEIIAQYEKNKQDSQIIEIEEEEESELTEEEKILELKSMSETARIHQYFSEYIKSVDTRDYKTAYGYLYEEFKKNYFPTQESFETYIEENYPKYLGVQYEDIERQGTYYVLTVKIYNAIDEFVTVYIEHKFIISELDFGKFVLSFQLDS